VLPARPRLAKIDDDDDEDDEDDGEALFDSNRLRRRAGVLGEVGGDASGEVGSVVPLEPLAIPTAAARLRTTSAQSSTSACSCWILDATANVLGSSDDVAIDGDEEEDDDDDDEDDAIGSSRRTSIVRKEQCRDSSKEREGMGRRAKMSEEAAALARPLILFLSLAFRRSAFLDRTRYLIANLWCRIANSTLTTSATSHDAV